MASEKYMESLMEVASDYELMSNEMFRLAHKLEDMPRYNPHHEMYSLVRNAEQATVRLRGLAARTDWANAAALYETVSDAMGIRVTEEPKWLKITLPAILPKRNPRDNTLYLARPLRSCLLRFQAADPIERFEKCVICIVHKYDLALGVRRVRDYDNIETKRYLDVIESVFLTNDSGLLCTVLQTTQMSDCDATEFYLMLPESLPEWAGKYIKSDS